MYDIPDNYQGISQRIEEFIELHWDEFDNNERSQMKFITALYKIGMIAGFEFGPGEIEVRDKRSY